MDSACTETDQKNEKNCFSECAALNVCGALRPNNVNSPKSGPVKQHRNYLSRRSNQIK